MKTYTCGSRKTEDENTAKCSKHVPLNKKKDTLKVNKPQLTHTRVLYYTVSRGFCTHTIWFLASLIISAQCNVLACLLRGPNKKSIVQCK